MKYTNHKIITKGKEKLPFGTKFIALRDTQEDEISGKCGQFYPKIYGVAGQCWEYFDDLDCLYVYGYGRFVVYENGRWFDDKETYYEIY